MAVSKFVLQTKGALFLTLDNPERQNTCNDCGEALENENPRPGWVAAHTIHLGDGGRKQSAERTADRRSGEEQSRANTKLGALVPAGVSVRTRAGSAVWSGTDHER